MYVRYIKKNDRVQEDEDFVDGRVPNSRKMVQDQLEKN